MGEVLRLDGVWAGSDRGCARKWVLEDASLSIDGGEVVSVVGGARQGKTTLIRLASGTLPPDRGVVHVAGVEQSHLNDKQLAHSLAGAVGLVIGAGPGVRVTMRAYVEMAVAAPKDGWRRRWRRRERRQMAAAVLDELGIARCAALRWDELSDWQRVLAELAQAVVVRPQLLLVDDPADGFGLRQKQKLADVLEDLASEYECGVLLTTADHGSAARAVRVWRLQHHRLRLIADHTDLDTQAGAVISLREWHDINDGSARGSRDA
jgi:ABC-type cobalamin/Fe3+-siderophores transport system ATPase subunit